MRSLAIVLAGLLLAAPSFAGDPCAGRKGCSVLDRFAAATDAQGARLTVLRTREPWPDDMKPDDHFACRPHPEAYWLLREAPGAAPVLSKIFAFCNDGYGASGVGEDAIEVGPNRIRHTQTGGSALRWSTETTRQLSPPHLLAAEACGYHVVVGGSELVATDYVALHQRGWSRPEAADDQPPDDVEIGCIKDGGAVPWLGIPRLGDGHDAVLRAARTGALRLGACALTMTPDNGFVVHGKAADRPVVRALLLDQFRLLVEVTSPSRVPAASASWIKDDRIELWLSSPTASTLLQIGVRLADGQAFPGYGKPKLPAVTRHAAGDSVTLLLDFTGLVKDYSGITLVYGQGDGKRQGMMLASSAVAYGKPHTLGQAWDYPADCTIRDGRLEPGPVRASFHDSTEESTAPE